MVALADAVNAYPDTGHSVTPAAHGAAAPFGEGRIIVAPRLEPTTAAAVARATVRLAGGSGFLAAWGPAGSGRYLTAWHVVQATPRPRIVYWDGSSARGRVAAHSAALDLAVVTAPVPPAAAPLTLGTAAPQPVPTMPIWVFGHPFQEELRTAGLSEELTIAQGIVSAYRQRRGLTFLQTDASINPGTSGGPVVTADGVVVAITAFKLTPPGQAPPPEGLGWALDVAAQAGAIRDLLGAAAGDRE